MTFALAHDDGQSARNYDEADVILVGVSRTSKTPTCIYLANRGIKAANVPDRAGLSRAAASCSRPRSPLIVGLTKDPTQLIQVRRNRLRLHGPGRADRLCRSPMPCARRWPRPAGSAREHGWPVIDVTRRSIEETAAAILQLLSEQRGTASGA